MREMGEAINVPRQTWNHWEKGRHNVPIEKAILLFQAYGMSLDYLYLGRGDPPAI